MKVIIVAAGQSSRLMPITDGKPKCMVEIRGKPILQRQLGTLKQCNINDVVVVRGYKKEMINYPNVRYYENMDYKNNNILRSLFYAESEMNDGFVFSYSDIIYEKRVLEKLLGSDGDIALVVDVDWISHYKHRYQHPVSEAEVVIVKGDRIIKIGKNIVSPSEAYGEFIGLAKFTKRGAEILKSNYRRVVNQYRNKQFHNAVSVEKAYLTDMIQELINRGCEVHPVNIRGGWMEIDTSEDLERARKQFT